MDCLKCGVSLPDPDFGKLSFRATCEKCSAALHCCENCKNYQPGQPNDCKVPGTDPISDRSANNFCEEFQLLATPPRHKKQDSKQRFEDLFK